MVFVLVLGGEQERGGRPAAGGGGGRDEDRNRGGGKGEKMAMVARAAPAARSIRRGKRPGAPQAAAAGRSIKGGGERGGGETGGGGGTDSRGKAGGEREREPRCPFSPGYSGIRESGVWGEYCVIELNALEREIRGGEKRGEGGWGAAGGRAVEEEAPLWVGGGG